MAAKRKRTTSPTFRGHPFCIAAHKYARAVVAGKIDVGKFTRLACERQLADLKRTGRNWAFEFKPEAAERVCKFVSLMPHTKGEWARPYRDADGVTQLPRIKLEPWQCFFLCCVFGWVHKKTGRRRYRQAYMEVPRKNAKSTLAAALALYMLCADGEVAAEVFCGAATEYQAWEVFRPAKRMAEKLPKLRERFGVDCWKAEIERDDGGRIEPVIGKPGDGASPHLAIVDEYHQHAGADQFDTFLTGMGARAQPLLMVTTTAGSDLGGPCYAMRIEIQKGLEDPAQLDETLFGLIYHLDPNDDPYCLSAVKKANPNYGISVQADYLLAQMEAAKKSPTKQFRYLTRHCNTWCGARSAWLQMAKWMKAEDATLTLERFAGQSAIYALDLASKLDFCASMRMFREQQEDGMHWYFFPHFWLPEDRIHDEETGRYMGWHTAGLIDSCDGAEVRYDYVEECLLAMNDDNPIEEMAFDPFHATQLAQRLEDNKGVPMISIGATVRNFSEPMKEFEGALASGRVHVPENPILRWMAGNVVSRKDKKDNVFPVKEAPQNKIDGMITMIMCVARAIEIDNGNSFAAWADQLEKETGARA